MKTLKTAETFSELMQTVCNIIFSKERHTGSILIPLRTKKAITMVIKKNPEQKPLFSRKVIVRFREDKEKLTEALGNLIYNNAPFTVSIGPSQEKIQTLQFTVETMQI